MFKLTRTATILRILEKWSQPQTKGIGSNVFILEGREAVSKEVLADQSKTKKMSIPVIQ